jgi:hypothetical protein
MGGLVFARFPIDELLILPVSVARSLDVIALFDRLGLNAIYLIYHLIN